MHVGHLYIIMEVWTLDTYIMEVWTHRHRICSLLARINAEQPVQHFYLQDHAIDWPEPA